MINFGFKEYTMQLGNWSKHHKKLGVFVKRECKDGEVNLTEDKLMQDYIEKYPNRLKSKCVKLFNRQNHSHREAVDYYFLLDNLEYQEPNIEGYFIGASNSEQTTSIRLKFLVGNNLFILEHEYKTSGSFATSFRDLIERDNFVRELINEKLDLELPFEEIGISPKDKNTVDIIVANNVCSPDVIEDIELSEICNSLVAVEIFNHIEKVH